MPRKKPPEKPQFIFNQLPPELIEKHIMPFVNPAIAHAFSEVLPPDQPMSSPEDNAEHPPESVLGAKRSLGSPEEEEPAPKRTKHHAKSNFLTRQKKSLRLFFATKTHSEWNDLYFSYLVPKGDTTDSMLLADAVIAEVQRVSKIAGLPEVHVKPFELFQAFSGNITPPFPNASKKSLEKYRYLLAAQHACGLSPLSEKFLETLGEEASFEVQHRALRIAGALKNYPRVKKLFTPFLPKLRSGMHLPFHQQNVNFYIQKLREILPQTHQQMYALGREAFINNIFLFNTLSYCAEYGDSETVEKILEKNPPFWVTGSELLTKAIEFNHVETVSSLCTYLLQSPIRQKNLILINTLEKAILYGAKEVANALIEPALAAWQKEGAKPLEFLMQFFYVAAKNDQKEIAQKLLWLPQLQVPELSLRMLLSYCITMQNYKGLQLLLQEKGVEAMAIVLPPMLYKAAMAGDAEIVRLLLQEKRALPYEEAIKDEKNYVIAAGENLILRLSQEDIENTFIESAFHGQQQVVSVFLEEQRDRKISPEALNEALQEAITRGHTEVVRTVLSAPAFTQGSDEKLVKTLLRAITLKHEGTVGLVLENEKISLPAARLIILRNTAHYNGLTKIVALLEDRCQRLIGRSINDICEDEKKSTPRFHPYPRDRR